MGKVKSFTLLLQENKNVFYPGETVKGTCELHIKDFVKISVISIELTGIGKVFWTETRSSGTRLGPVTENFRSEVEYVHAKQEIPFQQDRSESEPGDKRHAYSFQFTLPLNLVTSFEGKFGYVRYFLKADLVRPWPRAISVKKYITVIKPIDTNIPQYQRSIAASDESDTCCFCLFQSGSVHVTAQTDRVAYCPGESVAITARFQNNSVRKVNPYAVLCQTQKFHAKGLTQTVTYRLAMLTGLPIDGRQSAEWDSQLVRIPPVGPSVLNSALIEVHYCIKVGLVIPFCRDLRVTLPIVIGTIPFRQVRLQASTGLSADDNGLESSVPPPYLSIQDRSGGMPRPRDSEQSYSDQPPTYVESILSGGYITNDEQYSVNDDEETDDETEFHSHSRLPVSEQAPLQRPGELCRQTDNPSWWRRQSRQSTSNRRNTPLTDASRVNQRRRHPPTHSASILMEDGAGPSTSQTIVSRRFAPVFPYVAYPPPPSYAEVMETVETSTQD